jgi:xanthine dehydrogenase accessory factor
MENLDLHVLRQIHSWRAEGRGAILVTVIRTWGSSPRPVGSIMAMRDDGVVAGSVSGGCIEDDLIHRYSHGLAVMMGPPTLERYGIDADEAHRFGLPCGGTLELMIEHSPDVESLAVLLGALQRGELVRRTVRLADGTVQLEPTEVPDALAVTSASVANTFGPGYRMLLIGAGQLAEYVATMALFNGFAVTVCDPREEHSTGWSVAGARLLNDMPDDVVSAFKPDRRSCVIALTHDPKLDDLALMEALATPAFYVGAIGSRRNSELRRQRLLEHFDISPAALARLRGPIGLYIGSRTPSEIAVSVMAEVLAAKNGVALPAALGVAEAKSLLSPPTAPVCGRSDRSPAPSEDLRWSVRDTAP